MEAILELEATVSSKGQVTLPAAMRARFGLVEGSKIKFFCGDKEATLKPELPVRAYFGILKHLGNINTDMPKEPDRF
jgi:AbrB family looped-hinge helix DNA binding protein